LSESEYDHNKVQVEAIVMYGNFLIGMHAVLAHGADTDRGKGSGFYFQSRSAAWYYFKVGHAAYCGGKGVTTTFAFDIAPKDRNIAAHNQLHSIAMSKSAQLVDTVFITEAREKLVGLPAFIELDEQREREEKKPLCAAEKLLLLQLAIDTPSGSDEVPDTGTSELVTGDGADDWGDDDTSGANKRRIPSSSDAGDDGADNKRKRGGPTDSTWNLGLLLKTLMSCCSPGERDVAQAQKPNYVERQLPELTSLSNAAD